MPLSELSEELQLQVLQNLDFKSVLSLRQLSKHWHRLCDDEEIWQGLVETTFGVLATRPEFTWKIYFIASHLQYQGVEIADKIARAIVHNHYAVLEPLKPGLGWLALYLAVQEQSVQCVDVILDSPVRSEINWRDEDDEDDGRTVLHLACQRGGNVEIAKRLLAAGANPNITDNKHGFTPLCFAIGNRNLELVRLLIEHKADVNVITHEGLFPMYLCAEFGTVEIARLLREAGADPDQKKSDVWCRPIHAIASTADKFDFLRFLLDHGAQKEGVLVDEPSALWLACQDNRLDYVKLLIERGANVNCAHLGQTPLYIAVFYNFPELVEMLCAAGANVNKKSGNLHRPPLRSALDLHHLRIAQTLLQYGADPNV